MTFLSWLLVTKCCRYMLVPMPVTASMWSLELDDMTVRPVGMSSNSTDPEEVPKMARPSSRST